MRRSATLILVLAVSVFQGVAQPIIDAANFNPVVGESIIFNLNMTPMPNTGGIGAGQIWNHQNLTPDANFVVDFISPAGIPGGSQFSSNLCEHSAFAGDYTYYYADNGSLKYLGVTDATGSSGSIFTNPRSVFKYPLIYNTLITEIINETESSIPAMHTATHKGVQTWDVVSYGTLILPSGTFNNVLKVVHTSTDTTYYNSNVTANPTQTSTQWLYPGVHAPIMEAIDGAGVAYIHDGPLAVNEVVKKDYDFAAYPNPAKDYVNFQVKLAAASDISVQIFTTARQLVSSPVKDHFPASGKVSIRVSLNDFSVGNYMADVNIQGVHIYHQFTIR